MTLLSGQDGASLVRVIAGQIDGHEGPGVTYTPITYLHATIAPGSRLDLSWPRDFNALAYVLAGRGYAGREERPLEEGQLALFGSGAAITMRAAGAQPVAASAGWEVLLLGGFPIRGQVARYAPFVMKHTRGDHPGSRGLPRGPHGRDPRRAPAAPHERGRRGSGSGVASRGRAPASGFSMVRTPARCGQSAATHAPLAAEPSGRLSAMSDARTDSHVSMKSGMLGTIQRHCRAVNLAVDSQAPGHLRHRRAVTGVAQGEEGRYPRLRGQAQGLPLEGGA